ncbi:MAG: DUF4838 domain-containing protein [Gemmatimonadetes bacterium]|nr:DUF4838 domain-containing protein [Gemmatimonadota bacterium]
MMTYLSRHLGFIPYAVLFLGLLACKDSNMFVLTPDTSQRVQIVLPHEATASQTRAAQVLVEHLSMILHEPPRIGDDTQDVDIQIIIGPGENTAKLDLNPETLGPDGFHLSIVGSQAIIIGGHEKGAIYGAYELLEQLGFRLWTPGALTLPEASIQLPQGLSLTQVPAIEYRDTHYTPAHDPAFAEWHRLDRFIYDWGMWVHTFGTLIPPEEHFHDHPEWFSEVNGKRIQSGQLCLTNEGLYRALLHELRERIEAEPGKHYWSVSQNDTFGYCTCSNCAAIDAREESHSGALIAFVNRLATEFPDKTISTLAYQYSRKAPKHLRPADNVLIVLAPIELNRSKPVVDDPSAAAFRSELEDWARVTDRLLIWDYVIQFANLVSPFPNLRVLQPNLRYFVDQHAIAHFQQGNREVGGEWAELRTWMIAQLLWDPDADTDALIDEFLAGYYGAAAPQLRAYIDTQHDALAASGSGLGIFGNPISASKTYLTSELLATYDAQFDAAQAAVADNPTHRQRVDWARLPLHYARLEQAKTRATGEGGLFTKTAEGWQPRAGVLSRLDHFVDTAIEQGVTRVTEWHTTPAEYRERYHEVLKRVPIEHLAAGIEPTFSTPFSPKYPADGASTLTDGLRGPVDYRYGWLGWEGQDMEAVIDLGSAKTVRRVSVDGLQDIGAWVFMPIGIDVEVSVDGDHFTQMGSASVATDERQAGVRTERFNLDMTPTTARYVKVLLRNRKACPPWHGGAGGKAWIFTDEIVIE